MDTVVLILWMDEILHHLKTLGDASPSNTNEQRFAMVLKWCRISSTHGMVICPHSFEGVALSTKPPKRMGNSRLQWDIQPRVCHEQMSVPHSCRGSQDFLVSFGIHKEYGGVHLRGGREAVSQVCPTSFQGSNPRPWQKCGYTPPNDLLDAESPQNHSETRPNFRRSNKQLYSQP